MARSFRFSRRPSGRWATINLPDVRCPDVIRASGARSSREDPGSRRQVAAPRPGAARASRGRSPTRCPRRARRPGGSSATGASAVVIKAQVLVGGRGKAGGVKLAGDEAAAERVAGDDPRHGDQGHPGPQGARRAGRRHRPRVLHVGRARSGRPADPADGLGRGRRRDRAGRRRPARGDRPPPRRPDAGPARLPGACIRLRHGSRRPPQGCGRDRQGPRPDDARLRRRPRRDQSAGDRSRDRRGRVQPSSAWSAWTPR